MSKARFVKLVVGLKGIFEGTVSKTDAAWVFDKFCGTQVAIKFADFEKGLDKLAVYKGLVVEELRAAVVLTCPECLPPSPPHTALSLCLSHDLAHEASLTNRGMDHSFAAKGRLALLSPMSVAVGGSW